MPRPRPSALLKLVPPLAAALLTHCSAAAFFNAAGTSPVCGHFAFSAQQAQSASPAQQARPQTVSIKAARAMPLGSDVTIEGLVTTPPGAFKSSTEDEGFAVEDASGAGLYVRTNARPTVIAGVGRAVRVTGRLDDSNGKLVLVPAGESGIEWRRLVADPPRPRRFSTREIGEATEGLLVQVEGRITKPVQPDAPYGFRFFVDDGTGEVQIFVSASTKISQAGLLPGRRVTVTGFSGQYKDTYEVEPRFASDINLGRPLTYQRGRQRAQGPNCGDAFVTATHGTEEMLPKLSVTETRTRIVRRVRPKFPRSCMCQGTIVVRVLVNPEGRVECVGAVNGHPLLQVSSAEAAKRWTFKPLIRNGRPAAFLGVLAFNFHSHGKVTF